MEIESEWMVGREGTAIVSLVEDFRVEKLSFRGEKVGHVGMEKENVCYAFWVVAGARGGGSGSGL